MVFWVRLKHYKPSKMYNIFLKNDKKFKAEVILYSEDSTKKNPLVL